MNEYVENKETLMIKIKNLDKKVLVIISNFITICKLTLHIAFDLKKSKLELWPVSHSYPYSQKHIHTTTHTNLHTQTKEL